MSRCHDESIVFILRRVCIILLKLVKKEGLIACRLIRYLHAACASVFHVLDDEDRTTEYGSNHPHSGHVAVHPVTYDEKHHHRLMSLLFLHPPSSLLFAWRSIVARFGGVFQLNRYNRRSHCRCHLTRHADIPCRA